MSTAWGIPASRVTADTAARSVSLRVGLAGVSVNTSLVWGRRARSTLAGSEVSTKLNSTPNRVITWVAKRWVPPYTTSETTQ